MDLGCLDLGCIPLSDKPSPDLAPDEGRGSPVPSPTAVITMSASSKAGKSKMMKETGQSTNCLSKVSSQIRKPPRRKTSPVNWFPRKKVDSYLERKIKMLQEMDGVNLTLDETLGDANPHYCRVLREKIAVREAAHKAMEARKAALVEASWCRILRAARIQTKEAEALLEKAEKTAIEAFEAATAVGVIMYDKPNCPQKPSKVELSSVEGGFTTHTVTASFETAFEVDREVAAAVKAALVRLANCPFFSSKVEFKELLHKIRQNPDEDDCHKEQLEASSECESESGSDFERASLSSYDPTDLNLITEKPVEGTKQRKSKRRQSFEKLNTEKIVNMMFERLKGLQENDISSLATIVATCGLNAALAEVESKKSHEPGASCEHTNNSRRMSSCGVGSGRNYYLKRFTKRSQTESELPSLDKFLVKHETKLEKEVREARDHKSNQARDEATVASNSSDISVHSELPDLEKFLVKHTSKLEREVLEAKASKTSTDVRKVVEQEVGEVLDNGSDMRRRNSEKGVPEVPSLDKVLLKHVSRLEREVLEARNRRTELVGKENMKSNLADGEVREGSVDKILVKPVHRLEKDKQQALSSGTNYEYQKHQKKQGRDGNCATDCESLDKVLEEEKDGLGHILLRHKSRLEREKAASHLEPREDTKLSISRKAARENELQEAWGGMSLGNVMRSDSNMHSQEEEKDGLGHILLRHKSRLEREKAASHPEPREETKLSISRRRKRRPRPYFVEAQVEAREGKGSVSSGATRGDQALDFT
ncbi:hypothetical protein CRG98_008227 [Punica granatum]|uniref:Uncharacterized protein n=1 Tax=Punica granatum TaxID=22663 RepID=A0A2I0KSA8_PUNGR|nr:hypothetical protein CRG98_008227 [Punica granatum]